MVTHQRKVESNPIWREIWKNTTHILNSHFVFYFNCQKKYRIQSENIIMCCEFDAKMHFDTQNIKQFWYWASVLEFLPIAHAHVTTHGHTNSSTYIWYPEGWRSSSRSSHGWDLKRRKTFASFVRFQQSLLLDWAPAKIRFSERLLIL